MSKPFCVACSFNWSKMQTDSVSVPEILNLQPAQNFRTPESLSKSTFHKYVEDPIFYTIQRIKPSITFLFITQNRSWKSAIRTHEPDGLMLL